MRWSKLFEYLLYLLYYRWGIMTRWSRYVKHVQY
jgi:hypothetical protein